MTIIRPETLVRWHRAGFRRHWHWKSRSMGGRPQIARELRALIWQNQPAQSSIIAVKGLDCGGDQSVTPMTLGFWARDPAPPA